MREQEQEQEIDLGELFYLLLSKLHIIILVTVLGAICGYVISKFILPEKYTSSISIYVNNATEGTTTEDRVNYTDITAAQQLAETYIVILQDDVVYEEVSDLLLEDYDESDLKKVFTVSYDEDGKAYIPASEIESLVTIEAVDETEVISITVVTENPELSADICIYISNIAPDLLTRTTKAGSVENIGTVKVPTSPSSPNHRTSTLIGLAIGFVLAVAVIVIESLIDNRIKTSEDFKKRFPDIPVLTEIGDLGDNYKGGLKYEYR